MARAQAAGSGPAAGGAAGNGPGNRAEAGAGGGPGALPGTIAAAWGMRARAARGPKPALRLDRIVEAAVRVADTDGLEAVSMSKVAAELGTAPMSLYRHVAGKDELLSLMVDAAWGPAPDPPAPGESWRTGLSRWAWTMRDGARRHAWVVRIPLNGLPILPHEVAWFENALACMAAADLSEARKASVILLLAGYVRNQVTTEIDIQAAIEASGLTPDQWMASYPRMLTQLTDARRFPALTEFIAAGVFAEDDGPDDEFIFGLERILDGVAAFINA